MAVPNDVLRFEALLYLSLLLDALTAAFFGVAPADAAEPVSSAVNVSAALLLAALVLLVWLAAQRRRNWARLVLFGFFVLSIVFYFEAFARMEFGGRAFIELLSFVLSGAGFYFAFTADARQWFSSSHP